MYLRLRLASYQRETGGGNDEEVERGKRGERNADPIVRSYTVTLPHSCVVGCWLLLL